MGSDSGKAFQTTKPESSSSFCGIGVSLDLLNETQIQAGLKFLGFSLVDFFFFFCG